MNETKQDSVADSLRLDSTQVQRVVKTDSIHKTEVSVPAKPAGMHGEPLPYRMQTDWGVIFLLFVCFAIMSLMMRNGKKYLVQHIKGFFQQKERASLFDDLMGNDMVITIALGAVTCILFGVGIYDYYVDHSPLLFEHVPHWLLLLLYIGGVVVLVLFKRVAYGFVNWVFFDKSRSKAWINAYFDVLSFTSFLLFPFLMLVVYFNLTPLTSEVIIFSILGFAKILLFYKCFRNFLSHIYGLFHLILYFCALEIAPDLIVWKGLEYVNNILILNF